MDTTQDESSDAGSGDAKPSADQQAKVESRSATESAQQKQQPVDIVCLDSDSESDNDITQPPNNAAQAPAATTTNVPQQQQTPAPMSEVLPAVAAATAVQPTTSRASLTTATRLSDTDVVSTQLGVYENTPLFQQCERPAATTTTYAVTDDSSRYQETNRVSNNTDDYSQNMGMKTPVRIAPIGIPSNQRRNLILSNKRRYQKGRNSSNNRPVKVTKVQMEGNEVELIDLSSSDDDNNDEESTAAPLSFSSSSSSSSSSSGTDSPESFHIKKCMNGRMRRFELSNSESSDDDNKYEDDEEVIKSSCSQKDTQPPQQRTPQQNEPIQPPFTQQPKQQLSSVQQPMQQQQRQQQQQQQQSVKSVPPKITGFEQVLVKGNLVQKPIVLSHTNSHQSLSRTPSMQQVPLPPTNNQQPPEPQNTSFTSFSSFTTMQQPPQFVQQQQQQSATFESENVPTASQIRLEPLSQMSAPGIYQQQQANNSAIFGEPLTLAPFVEQPSSVQIPQFQNLYQTTQQPQGPTLMPLGPQHQNNVQQQLPSLPQQQRWQ